MSFMASGAAPFLDGHNPGKQIGVIEKAWIKDKKGRATVRFSKNPAADEVFQDIVDGIRKNISVGYDVKSMVLVSSSDKDGDTYRVDKWQPLEASSVSIPADMTVGVGKNKTIKEVHTMPEKEIKVDTAKIEQDVRDREINRIAEIQALGEHKDGKFRKDARDAIKKGWAVDKFRAFVLDELNKQPEALVPNLDQIGRAHV